MSNLVQVKTHITREDYMQLKLHAKSRKMTIATVVRARVTTPSVESLATEDRLAADLEARRTAGRSLGAQAANLVRRTKRKVKSDPGSE